MARRGRLHLPAVVLSAAVLGLLVAAAPVPAAVSGFWTPRHERGCSYFDTPGHRHLLCENVVTGTTFPGPKPAWCHARWGDHVGMKPDGASRRRLCVKEARPSADFPTLAFGQSLQLGPFSCRSRRSGLRCHNLDGHGFRLSIYGSTLF